MSRVQYSFSVPGYLIFTKGKRKAWQYPWKIYSVIDSLFYTIYDKSNVTNKISIWIMNPYNICDTRYELFYFQYHEILQDMWYKVLASVFTISWKLTWYAITDASYLIYNVIKLYRICDTRYRLFYLQYHETIQDMWIYIVDLTKHVSRYTCYAQTWIYISILGF
jgi:hypothetical protein